MATIEENLERIANSLAALQEVQLNLLDIATWNKERLEGKDPAAKPEPPPTVVPPAPAKPAYDQVRAAELKEYYELKAWLVERGCTVSRMATLDNLREWKAKKEADPSFVVTTAADFFASSADREAEYNDLKAKLAARGVEVKKGTKLNTLRKMWAEQEAVANVETSAPTDPANVETSAPAPASAAEPEKAPEAEKPLTYDQARQAIMEAGYNGQSLELRQALRAALEQLGAQTFRSVPQEKLRDFIALYKVNAGVANA